MVIVLDDLDGMRTIDRSRKTERQTRTGVVTLGRIVGFPLLLSPLRVRKLLYVSRDMGIGDVGSSYLSPNTRHAGFPVRKTRGWTREVHLASSGSLASLSARNQRHETKDADCGGHSDHRVQSSSHFNSPLFDQFPTPECSLC